MATCDTIRQELARSVALRSEFVAETNDPELSPAAVRALRARIAALNTSINAITARLETCLNDNPFAILFDLNGMWTDDGTRVFGPISAGPIFLTIDMSAFHRPPAHGNVLSNSTITVTFPDDATFIGQLEAPNRIRWSNNSVWTKVDTVIVPFVLNIPPAVARQDVEQAGLRAAFTGEGSSFVDSQTPSAGTRVIRGSLVTMHVASGQIP